MLKAKLPLWARTPLLRLQEAGPLFRVICYDSSVSLSLVVLGVCKGFFAGR